MTHLEIKSDVTITKWLLITLFKLNELHLDKNNRTRVHEVKDPI